MQGFDFDKLLYKFRFPLLILLLGIIIFGIGLLITKSEMFKSDTTIEVLESEDNKEDNNLTVEIAGEIQNPGVYKLNKGDRVEDLLVAAGGLTNLSDRGWIQKYLNRASELSDGDKIYIPNVSEHSNNSTAKNNNSIKVDQSVLGVSGGELVNINTASLKDLDSIPGIGQTYGQNIIEHRPYSKTEELIEKGVIKKNLYEKIKNHISVY